MNDVVDFLSPYSSLLQTVSFISTIILVIVSIRALRQLDIAKDTLDIQSQRESRKLATEYVYIFMDRIVKYNNSVHISAEDKEFIKSFHFSETDDDNLDIEKIILADKKIKLDDNDERDTYKDRIRAAYAPYAGLLNELEAFSSAITSGILDEKTLYRSVGQYYVNLIDGNDLDQVVLYFSRQENLYTNIAQIYDLWQLRINANKLEKIEKQSANMSKKISQLKTKIGNVEERAIRPIGVSEKK